MVVRYAAFTKNDLQWPALSPFSLSALPLVDGAPLPWFSFSDGRLLNRYFSKELSDPFPDIFWKDVYQSAHKTRTSNEANTSEHRVGATLSMPATCMQPKVSSWFCKTTELDTERANEKNTGTWWLELTIITRPWVSSIIYINKQTDVNCWVYHETWYHKQWRKRCLPKLM